MNYDKLSRSLRYYYEKGIMQKVKAGHVPLESSFTPMLLLFLILASNEAHLEAIQFNVLSFKRLEVILYIYFIIFIKGIYLFIFFCVRCCTRLLNIISVVYFCCFGHLNTEVHGD